jgi:predicted ester cyclase
MPTPAEITPILEECFNRRDSARLLALWTDDFHFEGPMTSFSGKDRMLAQEQNLWTAFPDIRCEIASFVAANDRIAFVTRMRGTHLGPLQFAGGTLDPSGRAVDFTLAVHMYFRNELIAGERVFLDTDGFMRQLGISKDAD